MEMSAQALVQRPRAFSVRDAEVSEAPPVEPEVPPEEEPETPEPPVCAPEEEPVPA
jgi:hypothetical protein